MFVQLIVGRVRHPEPVYVELDQWIKEVARSAEGWLGSTAGVTEDMRFVGLGRWENEEFARRQSARPEQDHWWSAFRELFEQPPLFAGTTDIFVDTPGDPDQAHFVQVLRGQGTNPTRARELMSSHSDKWATVRPEVLGTVSALFHNGEFTSAIYFSDETAAREGERKELPPDLQAQMDELNSLTAGPLEFFDLREPWIQSPT